jgi:parallel beta-helix repeat protein
MKAPVLGLPGIGSRLALAAMVLLAFVPSTARAATWNVPGDFSSIQAAHDAAAPGDTILVAPGTYAGGITLTKAITLASHFLTTSDPSFIGTTILDGGNGAYVIRIPSGAGRATIQGFTIQNSTDGILPNAKFDLLHCVVRDTSDGIDYENGSGGLVQFSTFELNSDDGIDLDNAVDIVIADNIIRNNGDDGIEIRMQNYTGPTLNIIIRRNKIHGNGEDGIQLIHYDVLTNRFFEISYNFIHDNVDAGIGMMNGAVTNEDFRAASIPERIHIFNNTFVNNSHGITGGDNTAVVNNIFSDHPVIAVKNVDGSSELKYNLFFGNGTHNSGSNVDAATSVFADPLLDANLELLPGSPAIDAGTAFYVFQGMVVLDVPPSGFSGAAPDIGAFEFDSGTGPAPDPPVLIAPPDGAADVGLTPLLEWSGEGVSFEVQVASDAGFGTLVDSASVPSTSYQVSTGVLTHLTTYFWRVRASNANGTSDFSTTWSFTTAAATTPPDPPVLLSPANGAVGVPLEPTLSWAGTADTFDVEVALDSGFSSLVYFTNTSSTSITVPPGTLLHETVYHWRVRGTNSFGPGDFSGAFSFTTVSPPDTLPPSQPQNLRSLSQTGSTIDLLWDASTDNVGVSFYRIYRDGSPIASESSPNHTAVGLLPGTSYDFQVSAVDEASNESPLSDVLTVSTLSVSDPVTISVQVSASHDDAEENVANGAVSLSSSDLELVQDGSKLQAVGIRFRNVAVPKDAMIQEASIQFTVDEAKTGTSSLQIHGEASDNPGVFTTGTKNVTNRPRTPASVSWSPPDWNQVGASGPGQKTPDLSSIVGQIVSRDGWAEGNAMVFFLTGSGVRTAEAFDGSPPQAPVLTVTYVTSTAPTPPPPPVLESPPDGATGVSQMPALSWSGVADSFDVEVAEDSAFTNVVVSTTVTTTSTTVSLDFAKTYFWRVRGTNSVGTGAFSSTFSFTTVPAPDTTPPTQPQNLQSPSQTGTTVDLTWDASSDDVAVVQYKIYVDNSEAGTSSGTFFTVTGLSPSTSYDFQVSAVDSSANESLRSAVLTVSTLSGSAPVTIQVKVSASEDDAEERLSNGSVNLNSSDLELVQDGSRLQAVGIRFRNVPIPMGALIQSADIQFTVDETKNASGALEIRGEASDNAAAFTSSTKNVTNRTTTTAMVPWSPPIWDQVGASGPDQRTPDLSEPVREIVGRSGWSEGNAIVFVFTGSGVRTAEAFNGNSAAAPTLTVTYQVP